MLKQCPQERFKCCSYHLCRVWPIMKKHIDIPAEHLLTFRHEYSGTFSAHRNVPRNCGAELGKSLRQEKNLLWVLAGNGGGSSDYPKHFIEELNGYANKVWRMRSWGKHW